MELRSKHCCLLVAYWLVACLVMTSYSKELTSGGADVTKHDFDGGEEPFKSFDFKVGIAPGAQQCFYQPVVDGIMILFKVLKGADRRLNVFIRRMDGFAVQAHEWVDNGDSQYFTDTPGHVHSVCLDNRSSREGKLVYLFMQVFIRHKITADQNEVAQFNVSTIAVSEKVANISSISRRISKFIHQSRIASIGDWYAVMRNQERVNFWSTVICGLQVAVAVVQVYFVRRLFSSRETKNIAKPRA